ncbi:MAG: hypothetical protein H6937_02460 [Burkholderiales bacterium]|nr:hypothetical protein [Burkholderiales bacterium]
MNFLQLCQRLRQEVDASGNDSTVVGATGEWKRLCDWINQSWIEIQQGQKEWNWMRTEVSFNTIANQAEYPYASAPISLTDFARWRDGSFRIYYNDVGDEHMLEYMDYRTFRDLYLISTHKTAYSYPSVITVSPSDSIILALPPDDIYTVTGVYYKKPTELSANTDEPGMPEQYHMLIVYRAMQEYGFYESAQEVTQRSTIRYNDMLQNLVIDETPDIVVDRGFA